MGCGLFRNIAPAMRSNGSDRHSGTPTPQEATRAQKKKLLPESNQALGRLKQPICDGLLLTSARSETNFWLCWSGAKMQVSFVHRHRWTTHFEGFSGASSSGTHSGGSNHHPLCSHGSCASIDGGGIENGPPLHLPSPFEGRKKNCFAIIARIFDDQKSENFLDDFLFFAVCGVKTGQKLFLRWGEKSVS